MKVTIQSSKAVKPAYGSGGAPATTGDVIPLSVFDNVNFDTYVSVMYAFRPPSPSNAALEAGLGRALADYPLWAGRLGHDADGRRAIVLNHAGVRFVEATADVALDSVMPLKPTPEVLSLHPSGDGVEELFLIQVTRFPCGSLVIGFTSQHIVADGRATNNFYLAWSQATRGVAMDPAPVLDRASFFQPRDPPLVEFDHRGVEFKTKKPHVDGNINDLADDKNHVNSDSNDSANDRNHVSGDAEDENHMNGDSNDGATDTKNHVRADIKNNQSDNDEEVVIEKVHFSREFIARLKAEVSTGAPRPYSTLQCVVAHLWRCMTKARGLHGQTTTHARIAVDGRARINPHVPDGYTGNVVLWALPTTTARELTTEPLQRIAELINRAVALVDESYFRSFIDFASSGAVEREGLAATADAAEMVLSPNVEVDSWLRIPFYDLDFGGGRPFFFMPTYLPVEGLLILLPSFVGDGSIDAYVPLFRRDMDAFKLCCYSLD